MKKLAALLAAIFLVLTTATPATAADQCQEIPGIGPICLTTGGGHVRVTGPLGIDLSAEVPPARVEVPVPTEITVTVTAPAPAPRTVTRTAIPSAVTKTVTETQTRTVAASPATVAPTLATPPPPHRSAGQETVPSDTIVQQVVRSVGVPLLWVLLGVALAIVGQYVMYAIGRSEAKHAERRFFESILNRKKAS